MIVYADSSALLKRIFEESHSEAIEAALADHIADDDMVVSSALSWIELERATRRALAADPAENPADLAADALSGVGEVAVGADVVSLARRIGPPVLRSLDAIHVATAILLDADVIVTYDDRLIAAAQHNGLRVLAPGADAGDRG